MCPRDLMCLRVKDREKERMKVSANVTEAP